MHIFIRLQSCVIIQGRVMTKGRPEQVTVSKTKLEAPSPRAFPVYTDKSTSTFFQFQFLLMLCSTRYSLANWPNAATTVLLYMRPLSPPEGPRSICITLLLTQKCRSSAPMLCMKRFCRVSAVPASLLVTQIQMLSYLPIDRYIVIFLKRRAARNI
jgi:hypothetical protein